MGKFNRFGIIALLAMALMLAVTPARADLESLQFTIGSDFVLSANPLTGVPDYKWYYGCSPTSGGMLMGYWSNQGYTSLLPGVTDPMVQTTAVNNAIAGIAGFMNTSVSGGTFIYNIPVGLADWTAYTGLCATTYHDLVSREGGGFSYADFKAEIDAGRPMLLNLFAYIPAPVDDFVGHSVVGYAYQDDMFEIKIPISETSTMTVSVPGFAVMDTWPNGLSSTASWLGADGSIIYGLIEDGMEWWPFLDETLTNGWAWTDYCDWQVFDGVFYEPTCVPVPATLVLFASGLVVLLVWRLKILKLNPVRVIIK